MKSGVFFFLSHRTAFFGGARPREFSEQFDDTNLCFRAAPATKVYIPYVLAFVFRPALFLQLFGPMRRPNLEFSAELRTEAGRATKKQGHSSGSGPNSDRAPPYQKSVQAFPGWRVYFSARLHPSLVVLVNWDPGAEKVLPGGSPRELPGGSPGELPGELWECSGRAPVRAPVNAPVPPNLLSRPAWLY
jgi:hypothetical protein